MFQFGGDWRIDCLRRSPPNPPRGEGIVTTYTWNLHCRICIVTKFSLSGWLRVNINC